MASDVNAISYIKALPKAKDLHEAQLAMAERLHQNRQRSRILIKKKVEGAREADSGASRNKVLEWVCGKNLLTSGALWIWYTQLPPWLWFPRPTTIPCLRIISSNPPSCDPFFPTDSIPNLPVQFHSASPELYPLSSRAEFYFELGSQPPLDSRSPALLDNGGSKWSPDIPAPLNNGANQRSSRIPTPLDDSISK